MADLLEELHARAGLDLLEAVAALDNRVHDGSVPDGALRPYVLVYTSVTWPSGEDGAGNSLDGLSVTVNVRWTLHCVGETQRAARGVQMLARQALLNITPVVAGRTCAPIQQDESLDPVRDETTGGGIFDAFAIYSTFSAPAA